jgi:3-hydroxyisobutyrate dehydrogenase-like beta-hydroxyacid dehydrogenase
MSTVGMVGLGEMGSAFVERLMAASHRVIGWNRTRSKADPLIARGMIWGESPRETADRADLVITMVANDEALEALVGGPDGILAGIRGKPFVEMSTLSPHEVQRLGARVVEAGGSLVDAAVLGSPLTVRQGKLVIMVAGDEATIRRVQPVLEDIGPKVFPIGDLGKAKLMKIALNLNLPAQLLALSEGLLLAEKGGIDRDKALDVMLSGAIASPMLGYRAPFIREMPAKAWFDVDMMEKDADLALALGKEFGVPLLATAVSREMLSAARGQGLQTYDFAVIYYALARCAGLDVKPKIGEPAP